MSVWGNAIIFPNGGSTNLINKIITENGEYNSTDDEADGYSSITVNVANTYTEEDEKKVVINGALVSTNIFQYNSNTQINKDFILADSLVYKNFSTISSTVEIVIE